jgi:hypothetical protein
MVGGEWEGHEERYLNSLLKLEIRSRKGGDGIIFRCGSYGKTRLKKGITFKNKSSDCEKIIACVDVFYEVLIVVELGNVVREGPKEA